jgi:hypothetical protein
MTNSVYVSLDHGDPFQKAAFGLLIRNPNHPLDCHDRSVGGSKITCGPDDADSKALRDEILKKLDAASKLVVLIGEYTYMDDWVRWEIDTFHNLKQKTYGDRTWHLIRGMRIENRPDAIAPASLGDRSTELMSWNPKELDSWINQAVTE